MVVAKTYVIQVQPYGDSGPVRLVLDWQQEGNDYPVVGSWRHQSAAALQIGSDQFQGPWGLSRLDYAVDPEAGDPPYVVKLCGAADNPDPDQGARTLYTLVCELKGAMAGVNMKTGDGGSAVIYASAPNLSSGAAQWQCVQVR